MAVRGVAGPTFRKIEQIQSVEKGFQNTMRGVYSKVAFEGETRSGNWQNEYRRYAEDIGRILGGIPVLAPVNLPLRDR